jgi:hypothetical protein
LLSGFLVAQAMVLGGFTFEVIFSPAITLGSTCPQHEKHASIVALDAVVTAHGKAEEWKPEEILALPAGSANIRRIAKSTYQFH